MKKTRLIGLMAAVSLLVTGCGMDAMPDLTDEQSALISEYAAGLLLKYSKYYDYRLVDVEVITSDTQTEIALDTEESLQEAQESETNEVQSTEENDQNESETETESESETVAVETDAVSSDTDLAPALGYDGLSIKYASYEVDDSYTEGGGYMISAGKGKKLLVVNFDVKNNSGSETTLDISGASALINGTTTVKAMTDTLLDSDLTSIFYSIGANTSGKAIIAFEISEASAQDLSSISVDISSNYGSIGVKIK